MSTTANDPSLYKLFTWLLLAALIGVYALYNWHQGNLAADLAGERKEVAAATDRLSEAEGRIQALRDTEQGLKAEIARLESAAAVKAEESAAALDAANSQVQGLRAKLDASTAEVATASGRIEALTTELEEARDAADSLATRLQAAEQVESDLRAELAGAADRMQALEGRVVELDQALAGASADAESRIQAVRDELKERIDGYRSQLEGDDPERAAWIATLEGDLAKIRAERDAQVEQADAAARALAEAKDANAELQAQVADLTQGLATERSSASALRQELEQASGQLEARVAELEQVKKDAQVAAKALGEARSEGAQASEQIAALKADLRSERDAGARLKTQLESTLARAAEEKQSLEQRVAEQAQALEQARADIVATRQAGETAMKEMQALYDRFSALGGIKTERGLLLSIGDEVLRFQSGLAILPGGDLPSLDQIAALLSDYPDLAARIEGHTDSAGPEEINLNLSKARADAVRDALIERGVASERLVAEGIGEARPVADNASPEGRRKNRRVEIYVLQ